MASLLRTVGTEDIDFIRGEGAYLWDASGRRYLDLESGSWSAVLGHGHPRITQVIREQAGRVVHLNVRHYCGLAKAAAERLLALSGQEGGSCVFLSSGSEAVEFSVQAIRRLSGRKAMVKLEGGYMAAYGAAGSADSTDWLTVRWRGRDREEVLCEVAGLPWERIAGFVLEPGGASPAFMRFPPAWLVQALAREARLAGGYVVGNEITTGMAKTGRWFGFQHYGVEPDAVSVGKGLGNGYPVSAAALSPALAARYEEAGLNYAQSHQNDPLGCAVALAVMEELECGGWLGKARAIEAWIAAELASLPDPNGAAAEFRARGALVALEFRRESGLTGEAAYKALWEGGVISACYPSGSTVGTGLRFDLPLCLEREDFAPAAEILGRILSLS